MAGFVNPLTQGLGQDPNKTNAVQRLVHGPNGPVIQYFDPVTGQPVNNANGYNIVTSQINDINSLGLNPTDFTDDPGKPTDQPADAGSAPTGNETTYDTPSMEGGDRGNHAGFSFGGVAGNMFGNREVDNNYGYIDKPGLVSAAGMLPGVLGMAGKAVNAGINANNLGAVNAARESMGVDKLGFKDSLKGVLSDRKGFVANVDVKDKFGNALTTPVSLEAIDPKNYNSMISPEMAKAVGFDLSANQKPSKESSNKGLIRSFLDDLFADDDDKVETVDRNGTTAAKERSGGLFDVFPGAPDAPEANTPTNKDGTNQSNHSKERERNDWSGFSSGGGLSDAAKDAVDKGTGGLY